MKKVFFLCYSRYVLYVAFCLKKLIHINDSCTLIISDQIKNENGLIEHIQESGIWERVIKLEERDIEPEQIRSNVRMFVDNEKMDIFYTANVLRCASHYFIYFLKDCTEINMFDEGIISLDLVSGYNFYKRKGLPDGWIEFDFNRVNKFYVFFPRITKTFGHVRIVPIDMTQILKFNMTEFVKELNIMFDYQYQTYNKEIMFIDSDMALQGSITQEYENHCIDNIMNFINLEKCIVKLKPSISAKMINIKYGNYDIKFLNGGNVPFEIVYLNAVISNDVPKVIIALPTTAIWNINELNQKLDIQNIEIISLFQIMYEYFYYPGNGKDMLTRLQGYQKCFNNNYLVKLPKTWEEFYEYFKSKYCSLCKVSLNIKGDEEYKWLINEYNRLTLVTENAKYNARNNVLKNWVSLNNRGIRIEQFFQDKGINKVILYGHGIFGKLFIDAIDRTVLDIPYIIKSDVNNDVKYIDNIPILSVENYLEQINEYSTPILITAVGKELEVLEIINAAHIKNKIYRFKDIMEYLHCH